MRSQFPSPAASSQGNKLLLKAVLELPQPLSDALVEGGLVDGGLLLSFLRTEPEVLGLRSAEPARHLDNFYDAGGGGARVVVRGRNRGLEDVDDGAVHTTLHSRSPTLPALAEHTTSSDNRHARAARSSSNTTVTPPTRTRLRLKSGKERPEHVDGLPSVTLPDSPVQADGLKPDEVIPDGFTVRTDFAGVFPGSAHLDVSWQRQMTSFLMDARFDRIRQKPKFACL